jgi:hypothetical protein
MNYSSVVLPKESSESYRFSVARQVRDSRCDQLPSQPRALFTGLSKRDAFGKSPLQLITSRLKTNLASRGIVACTRAGKRGTGPWVLGAVLGGPWRSLGTGPWGRPVLGDRAWVMAVLGTGPWGGSLGTEGPWGQSMTGPWGQSMGDGGPWDRSLGTVLGDRA